MAYSRDLKKIIAVERAKRRLQHRLADIDWEYDVLQPKVKEIQELEATNNLELEPGDEDIT